MRGSRNFRQVGRPGLSVIKRKKISDNVFLCFFLVLNLFYRSPMVYFKENCNFPRFQRGSIIFSKGSLGVQLFTGGGGGEAIAYSLYPY